MPSFQIEQFERADAPGETVSVRIDGRWLAEQPEVVSDPILLIRNGSDLANRSLGQSPEIDFMDVGSIPEK